jgi:hypothetical protein
MTALGVVGPLTVLLNRLAKQFLVEIADGSFVYSGKVEELATEGKARGPLCCAPPGPAASDHPSGRARLDS